MKNITIVKNSYLLDYLLKDLNYNRKKAKSILKNECILVNNKIITQFNYELKIGDQIQIQVKNTKNINHFNILYEDNNIVVVTKPYGLLTIATKEEKDKTLYHYILEYVKTKNKNNKIFIIHRLDKETSGILIFAKNEKTKKIYQNNWNQIVVKRKYVAVVEGIMPKEHDMICIGLKETNNYKMVVDITGEKAITEYSVIQSRYFYLYRKKEPDSCKSFLLKTSNYRRLQIRF